MTVLKIGRGKGERALHTILILRPLLKYVLHGVIQNVARFPKLIYCL